MKTVRAALRRGKGKLGPFTPPAVPLEQLASEQNVKPVQDLDELRHLWPADDEPDDFLDWLLKRRAERRAINRDSVQ